MGESEGVSPREAALWLIGAPGAWGAACILALVLSLSNLVSLAPGSVGALLSFLASVPVIGYQVSVSRSVYLGQNSLPSKGARFGLLRRGLSVSLILLLPSMAFAIMWAVAVVAVGAVLAVLAGGRELFGVAGAALARVAAVAPLVVAFPLLLFVMLFSMARYIAFDRVSEGMKYAGALRTFRSLPRPGWQLLGWSVLGSLLLLGARYLVELPFGIASLRPRQTVFSRLLHGDLRAALPLLAITVVFGVMSALWQLIAAHMLGRYASLAYPDRLIAGPA
jgi:hypothetical protein